MKDISKFKADLQKLQRELYGDPVPGLPPALGVCEACIQAASKTERQSIYCSHNKAGAYFIKPTGQWNIISPIEQTQFEQINGDTFNELPPMLGLCDDCARRTPVRSRLHLMLYCKHNNSGAFCSELVKIWTTVFPISRDEFAQGVGIADAVITHNAQAEAPPEGERH